ncbi:MAG TPA: hypothetical protein PLB81_07015 [Deltaproteobacteria bacterium]|nr:hypothetical protein [Deltaproteobacteria bacterium]
MFWKDQVFWTAAAVIVASIAAIWTGYVNYKLSLSSFKVNMGAGNPAFTTCIDKEKGTYSLCPIVPLEFVNVGAKPGLVNDVMLVVSTGQWKSKLIPIAFAPSFGQEALDENRREVFHPFALNAKERLFKNVIFYPGQDPGELNSLQMNRGQLLPEGNYNFEFYLNTDADNKLKLVYAETYYVPKEVVNNLAIGIGPMYIPTGESIVRARKVLK